jgi:small subunit ribosomal protein S1
MNEPEDFATMFAREAARTVLEVGQVGEGRVIQITAESVFVDVGGKGEAWIERAELTDDEGKLRVAIGDQVEATVVSTGDEVRLSHKLRQGAQARQALAVAAQTGIPVEGKVAGVIKGGYEVTVGGLRGFCPLSQMDLRRAESAEEYVGRVLEFRVTTFSENGRNLVLSRRRLLEERAAEAAEETRKKIAPGAVLTGTVSSLADFGAFIDLGGVQGLVPLSELSHSRASRPADLLRIGDAVTVKVLRVDQEKGRISLSLKRSRAIPGPRGREAARAAGRARARGALDGIRDLRRAAAGVDGPPARHRDSRSRQGASERLPAASAEIAVLIVAIDSAKRRVALAPGAEGAGARAADAVERRGRGGAHRAPSSGTSRSASSSASVPARPGSCPRRSFR